MKTLKIKGFPRAQTGKKDAKRIRQQGQVPCVMYGGEKNIHFSAEMLELHKLVYTPDNFLIQIELDGVVYKAVMQDVQFHSVSDEIIHIDFVQVFDDKKVTVNLPIELKGSSIGILSGGKLRQRRRHIKVQGLIKDMPDRLEVDMSSLDIGEFLKVGDLDYENLEILDPAKAMVVGVVSSRLIAKGMEEEVIEEAVSEDEVVEEGAKAEGGETPEADASDQEDTSQEG
jgi:large subunit ribosomal protein L25